MIILKIILAFSFILLLKFDGWGQMNKLNYTEVNIKYEHFIFKYNENEIKFTSKIDRTGLYNDLDYGFQDYVDMKLQLGDNEKKERYYMLIKYAKEPKVDTVNTVLWFNNKLPENQLDSAILLKKVMYSFVVHKNKEKRLNVDNVVKVRMLCAGGNTTGQGWYSLTKVCFYTDSAVCTKKLSDIKDLTGRTIIEEESKKISKKKQLKLLNELEKLSKYEGYECLNEDDYPTMIEYYDGITERTFIISQNICEVDKNLNKTYINVIQILFNM